MKIIGGAWFVFLLTVTLPVLPACGDDDGSPTPAFSCPSDQDTDADGISDCDEGREVDQNSDGDEWPDWRDLDSDEDGISDADEAGSLNPDAAHSILVLLCDMGTPAAYEAVMVFKELLPLAISKLDSTLGTRVPPEKLDEIQDKVVGKMREHGVLREEEVIEDTVVAEAVVEDVSPEESSG